MLFADLTDTDYVFSCQKINDSYKYWDYDFYVERWDDQYIKSLNTEDVLQLRENCKKILQATDFVQGVYHD